MENSIMKITNIEKIEKDSNYCDITTATENFYIKAGSKELLVHNSPALFCYSKFPGYPDNSICLKSFVANANNVLSSEEEIEERYGDRAEMAEKLKFGLELAKYIPEGECWQGDCLFTQRDLKEQEIEGTKYLTFQPNKIVYAFSEDNEGYEKVRDAAFGIAFHTIYKAGKGGGKTQS